MEQHLKKGFEEHLRKHFGEHSEEVLNKNCSSVYHIIFFHKCVSVRERATGWDETIFLG